MLDPTERPELLPFVPAARSFLDVGCGGGQFGRGLRRALGDGVQIVGIEAEPDRAVSDSYAAYDEVIEGYFPEAMESGATDAGASDRRFECIFFNDVLEHMLEPWDALATAHRWLAPGGTVVASIPSIQFFPVVIALVRRGRWDYADWGTLDRTHLRFFTRKTMVEMFEQAGFTVTHVTGINSAFTLAKWRRFRRLAPLVGDAQWMQFVIVAHATDRGRAAAPDPQP